MAPADGYTLLMMANSFTVTPSLQSNLPYDSKADFAPVSLLTITPHVLVARQDLPADDLKQLLDLARKKPGTVTYASIGNHGDAIALHAGVTSKLDYEAELGIIIGGGGCNIDVAQADAAVFGYCSVAMMAGPSMLRRSNIRIYNA